jgi:hypothetical protein
MQESVQIFCIMFFIQHAGVSISSLIPSDFGSTGMGYTASKRVQSDWKLVLGEVALDIRPGKITQGLQGGERC